MPEVQGRGVRDVPRRAAELQAAYGRLGVACALPGTTVDETLTAALIMATVESVIQLRRMGKWRDDYAHEIAAACLRLAGIGPEKAARARAGAAGAMAGITLRWPCVVP